MLLPFIPTLIAALHASAPSATPAVPPSIALSTSDTQLQSSIEHGMESLLLGELLTSQRHFRAALARDPQHPLALCGLLMSGLDTASFNKHAATLNQLPESYHPTPQESRYLEGLFLLISQQQSKAQTHFLDLSTRYRADLISRLWAALLIQDGYDELHAPRAGQSRAIALLDDALQRSEQSSPPSHGLLPYMRAYLEADAPQPSERAIECARRAQQQLTSHSMPKLLAAHLLTRRIKQQPADAAALKQEAYQLLTRAEQHYLTTHTPDGKASTLSADPQKSYYWLRLRLYRIAILLKDQRKQALDLYLDIEKQCRRELQLPPSKQHSALPTGRDLLLWEWSLIPLREYMHSQRTYTQHAIDTLTRKPLSYPLCRDSSLHRSLVECLRLTLLARMHEQSDNTLLAHKLLADAQRTYKDLENTRALDAGLLGNPLFARAMDTCSIALCLAQIEIYADTADIWREKLQALDLRASLLMPSLQAEF